MTGWKPGAAEAAADETVAAPDYRPSVRLAPEDEIRLLDVALREARARPRPPAVTLAALTSQAPAPRLPEEEPVNGELAHVNGHTNGVSVAIPGGDDGDDAGDDILIDRKRLLAAIICILQDELTKTRPASGEGRRAPAKRPARRTTRVRSTVIRETEGGPPPHR